MLCRQHSYLRRSWKIIDIFQAERREKELCRETRQQNQRQGGKLQQWKGPTGGLRGGVEGGCSFGNSRRPVFLVSSASRIKPAFPVWARSLFPIPLQLWLENNCYWVFTIYLALSLWGVQGKCSSSLHFITKESGTQETWKAGSLKGICTPMFIVVLFAIAER